MLNKRSLNMEDNQLEEHSTKKQKNLMNYKKYLEIMISAKTIKHLLILYLSRNGYIIRDKELLKSTYNSNNKYSKITKISNQHLIKQIKIYKTKIKNEFDQFIKDMSKDSYCNYTSKLMYSVYNGKRHNRNYLLQSFLDQSYNEEFSLAKYYRINVLYLLLATFCNDINNNYYSPIYTMNNNYSKITKAILIYTKFTRIEQEIIYHLSIRGCYYIVYNNNQKNYTSNFQEQIQNIVDLTLKEDIKNGNKDVIDKLITELQTTYYHNAYENNTISNYIYKIISKLFPNDKKIKSNTYNQNKLLPNDKNIKCKKYNKAFEIVSEYQFLSIYTQSLNKKKPSKFHNTKIEKQFKEHYLQYINNQIIKDSFYYPELELANNINSINHLFHEIIAENLLNPNDILPKYKIKKMCLLIFKIIQEYRELLPQIKKNKSIDRSVYKKLIVYNKLNNDNSRFELYVVPNTFSMPIILPKAHEISGYFSIIYQALCRILSISGTPNDHCDEIFIYQDVFIPNSISISQLYQYICKFDQIILTDYFNL